MRRDENLPLSLELVNERSQEADNSLVERQLRLFKKQQSRILLKNPEQPDQAKRPVRELVFPLPCTIDAPVRVFRLQVRLAAYQVSLELKLLQLGNRLLQNGLDPVEAPRSSFVPGGGDPLQERLTKRIVLQELPLNAFCVLEQLRDKVKVDDTREKLGNVAEIYIAIDLF